MPDDSLPPFDNALRVFFEAVAFAMAWGGVDRLLAKGSPLVYVPIFIGSIAVSYVGFQWPQIKVKAGDKFSLV